MTVFFRFLLLIFLLFFPLNGLLAQSVSVQFMVNMSYQEELGNFNPDNDFVDIAGSFNGWDGSNHVLTESDDGIYEISAGGFSVGETIQFKFRINGTWDGNEEFPGGGPNRTYTVTEGENVILVWYSDETPPTGPPSADFSPTSISIFENGSVWFRDMSAGLVTEWEWHFEGGLPEISNQKNPVVVYENTGLFDVTLIAKHEDLADTLTISNVVEVGVRDDFETYWWNDAVFYEIFVRSFFDSSGDGTGDFSGLTEKLDYLNDGDPETDDDLGITGIWLMPIHPSPSYHGYDVTDYKGVNSQFGSMDQFKTFVEEAQSRGIRVIIDFVLNHSSSQHPWFINSRNNVPGYREYYRWRTSHPGYNGPWGQPVWHQHSSGYYYGLFWGGMPDINFDHEPVKDALFEAAQFWLNDVGVDGFRLDAVTYIFEDGSQLEHVEETFHFWEEFNTMVKQQNPDAVTVGEAWTNTEQILPYVTNNRLDFAFEFDLASSILNAVRSGNTSQLYAQMQKVYNSYNYLQFGTFLTNHDQNRVMNELNDDWEKAKTAASIYLTLPGVPFLYYGEEVGMTGAKPDPQIRTPMQWTDGPNAGFTTGSPWINLNTDYQIRNVAVQREDPESLFNTYRRLIHLRNTQPALRTGSWTPVQSSVHSLFSFLREKEGDRILVIANTGTQSISSSELIIPGVPINSGTFTVDELFSGDSFGVTISTGNRIEISQISGNQTLILNLEGLTQVSTEPEGNLPSEFRLKPNYPNPFNPITTIRYKLPENADVRIEVFNILGQRVQLHAPGLQPAGTHHMQFDGLGLSSGVYVYHLIANGVISDSRKMLLLK